MLIIYPSSIEHFGAVSVLPTNVFLATLSLPPQFSPRWRRIDPVGGRGSRAIWSPRIRSARRRVFDQTAYDYDLAGRLDQVAQTGGSPTATFDYGFEPSSFNLIETVTGPHHLVTNEWEGTRNVLDSKTNTDFASTPETHSAYDYTVNDLGQRTAVDASGTAFGTSQRDRTWKYDSFGQLVSEADSNNAGFDRGFAFDDIGNRTASISGDTDPSATGAISYTPDALNQYDTITDPASQVSAPSYDADGNATSLSLRKTGLPAPAGSFEDATLIWDGENRLIEIKAANNTTLAKYQYDSQSRRIRRDQVAAHDTAYLYDGWNPIAEYRFSAGTYDLHLTNLWGLDLSGSMQGAGGVGGLLAVNVSGTTYYPTYDGNGNVSEYLEHIIDSDPGTAGNQPLTETSVHFEYDAFGNILDFTETSTDLVDTFSHRFSTKQQDHESGLLYYGYRFYDPVTGRWPSRDPIEERGGINLYGMVGNDAVGRVDFIGLAVISEDGDYPLTGKPSLEDDSPGMSVFLHHKAIKGKAYIQLMFITEYRKGCDETEDFKFIVALDLWNTSKMLTSNKNDPATAIKENGAEIHIRDNFQTNGGQRIKFDGPPPFSEKICKYTQTVVSSFFEVETGDIEKLRRNLQNRKDVENEKFSNMFRINNLPGSGFRDPFGSVASGGLGIDFKMKLLKTFSTKYTQVKDCEYGGQVSEKLEITGDITSEVPIVRKQ